MTFRPFMMEFKMGADSAPPYALTTPKQNLLCTHLRCNSPYVNISLYLSILNIKKHLKFLVIKSPSEYAK